MQALSLRQMQEFSSQGVRIAYIDAPPGHGESGRPVLLIHGFASNHAVNWVFPQWLKTLNGAGRRVVAFDNRGHGRSGKLYRPGDYTLDLMAADARNLLDHLGIPVADIIGYSLGARIATAFALAYPQRANALVFGGLGSKLFETPGSARPSPRRSRHRPPPAWARGSARPSASSPRRQKAI